MKNKTSNRNNSDLAIAFIVIFTLGLVIGHYRLIGFIANLFEVKSEETVTTELNRPVPGSKMTTYYQWFDINGKMRISQFEPQEIDDYITFQGSQNLRNVSYDIDKALLAKGMAYRTKLLSGGNSQAETEDFLEGLLNNNNISQIDSDEHCAGLTGWLSDISQTISQDVSTQKLFCAKYQVRLQKLQQMGCVSALKSFERQVCK